MIATKSPGGSTFPYYYKGGEVHCLKYGSYFGNHAKLFDVMHAEEDFIAGTNKKLRIWVDFYDTKVSAIVLTEFIDSLERMQSHIFKLAIVGLSFRVKWQLTRRVKKLGKSKVFGIRYFVDPEDAKTWLVGE